MCRHTMRRLGTHYNRIRVLSEIENRFDRAIVQHKKIIAMIENKEVDQVENILSKHIMEPIKLWENLYHADSPYISYFNYT